MKEDFIASFIHKGVLGRTIYLKPDMADIKVGHGLFSPTATITLKEKISYKFIVFARKRFPDRIDETC